MNEYRQPSTQQPVSVNTYIGTLNRVLSGQRGRIQGEVTSIKAYPKTVYFEIKDKDGSAILNCMIWLNVYQANGINLKAGDEIIVTGTPNIYAPSGKLSLMATTIEYAGEGALKQAYDRLKLALSADGLLSQDRKRPMPQFPKRIGLITSMSGVVIQDFSANLNRHGFKIKTFDSRVEGKDAIHDLLKGLEVMSKQDIDILVIIRGGGSLESLQAFNTEAVVRAVASFKAPVITGIGHDVDVTLTQLVADIGKSTPTAVAEAFNEPWDGLASEVNSIEAKTLGRFRTALSSKARYIESSETGIIHTYYRSITETKERLAIASTNLKSAFGKIARRVRDAGSGLSRAMGIMKSSLKTRSRHLNSTPNIILQQAQYYIKHTRLTTATASKSILQKQARAIRSSAKALPAIEQSLKTKDPRHNIRLGYSLSYVDGKLARSIADVTTGQVITTQLVDGQFTSEVKAVE